MANLMQSGEAWLSGQLTTHAGTLISYVRAGKEIPITAVRSVVTHEVIGRDGFTTRVLFYDWIITAAELVLFGEAVVPQQRDTIEVGGERFEVQPIDEKRPCFEPIGNHGQMIVVHSKKVSS